MDIVPTDSVHLVLDVDAEVSRLGYGDKDFKGMELLQAAAAKRGLTVNHHPGIRIGLLIVDNTTLIYSPTAEYIETESRQPNKPNAIVLQAELPVQLANACAVGEEKFATLEVGKEPIDQKKVAAVKQDLADRPAKPFNVARIERVFSSLLQYVELRIEDYKLTSRSLKLNSRLFGVQNAEVAERLVGSYHLFSNPDSLVVEISYKGTDGKPVKEKFGPKSVDKERDRIKEAFVIEAGDFGLLILKKDVAEFEKRIELLRTKVAAFKTAVQSEIGDRTDELVDELLKALQKSLQENPPEHWRSRYLGKTPTLSDVQRLFGDDIRAEVKRVKTDFNPKIFTAYKEATYQTFKDEKFRKIVEERFGKEAIEKIFSEYDAAPETRAEGGRPDESIQQVFRSAGLRCRDACGAKAQWHGDSVHITFARCGEYRAGVRGDRGRSHYRFVARWARGCRWESALG
jgi:hypothetical protein